MVGHLAGTVKAIIKNTLVVGTESGVGYRVHVPTALLASTAEGDMVSLWTHLAVRDNAHDLYGFVSKEELAWFELLLSVSSVGPRSALSIMSSADILTLESAIVNNDALVLARAFGIGRKTAEKIVLELKEKVEPADGTRAGVNGGEVVDALISLGYSAKEARDAARAVPKNIEGTESRIREALRQAAGG
ncbi:MAG: Holliday junction branch migration protein RuvA [Candidatus Paceibacteria bacterium]